jgi:anti-sigma-K factor RskA
MSDDAHVLDLLPAYAVGSLDAEETRRVEQHLLSCLICRDESNALQGVAEQLSFAAPVVAPSPELKDRLMQRVRTAPARPRQVTKRPWRERFLPVWGLASFCLIVALAGLNLFLWQRLAQPQTFAARDGMRTAPLSSPDRAAPATGVVLVSEDGDSGALVVDGLPPLADGRQYQVWLIREGQITSGGVFSTDEKSYGTTRIHAPASLLEYAAVDITIEPTGGSPQPTGRRVLGGPLFNP